MPTTSNGDCCVSLMQGTLVRPIARYPASIAHDDPLKVASNRVRTTLVRSVHSGDTLLTVSDASRIVEQMLLSIDSEIVSVSAVDGNILTVIRGFDGTQPCSHSAGSTLEANIVAWHHNVLAAEITAIETALGVNLSNVGGDLGTGYWVFSVPYDFQAQQPGGSLVAGSNVINLAPVPKGVNGSDTNHYVWISGGTGTAESALITGGTAVAGAASGTLIVTCANTHSGAWTVRSATAGIQEALQSLPNGRGLVYVPAGNWTINAPITLRSYQHLRGFGKVATLLESTSLTNSVISLNGTDQSSVSEMQLQGPNTGSAFAIRAVTVGNLLLRDLTIAYFPNGISVTGNVSSIVGTRLYIAAVSGDGIYINTPVSGGTWSDVMIYGDGVSTVSKGLHVVECVGLNLLNFYTNGSAYGVEFAPPAGKSVAVVEAFNALHDGYATPSTNGILIAPQGGTVSAITYHGGGAGGFSVNGIVFQGTGNVTDVSFNGLYVTANTGGGISIPAGALNVKNVTFTDCRVEANAATPGVQSGATLQNGTNITFQGGVYAAGSYGNGSNIQGYGINIGGGTTNVRVLNCVLTPNLGGPIFIAGSNPGLVVRDCAGYNPVGVSAITVGASPFLYTTGPCAETIYIQGASVTGVSRAGTIIANAAPPTGQAIIVPLAPNTAVNVTYSGAAPTMFKDVQ